LKHTACFFSFSYAYQCQAFHVAIKCLTLICIWKTKNKLCFKRDKFCENHKNICYSNKI